MNTTYRKVKQSILRFRWLLLNLPAAYQYLEDIKNIRNICGDDIIHAFKFSLQKTDGCYKKRLFASYHCIFSYGHVYPEYVDNWDIVINENTRAEDFNWSYRCALYQFQRNVLLAMPDINLRKSILLLPPNANTKDVCCYDPIPNWNRSVVDKLESSQFEFKRATILDNLDKHVILMKSKLRFHYISLVVLVIVSVVCYYVLDHYGYLQFGKYYIVCENIFGLLYNLILSNISLDEVSVPLLDGLNKIISQIMSKINYSYLFLFTSFAIICYYITDKPGYEQAGEHNIIGEGGQGRVYKLRYVAYKRSSKFPYINKVVEYRAAKVCPKNSTFVQSEIKLLRRLLDHQISFKHLPRLCETFDRKDRTYIITEFIQGKTLEQIVKSYSGIDIRDNPEWIERCFKWLRQVNDALEILHDLGIMHRDVKPANVIVNQDDNAVLVDLGLSKEPGDRNTHTDVHTPLYRSPEFFHPVERMVSDNGIVRMEYRIHYGYPADMFALGVSFMEVFRARMFTKEEQLGNNPRLAQLYNADNPDFAREIITQLLEVEPDGRLTSRQLKILLIQHP